MSYFLTENEAYKREQTREQAQRTRREMNEANSRLRMNEKPYPRKCEIIGCHNELPHDHCEGCSEITNGKRLCGKFHCYYTYDNKPIRHCNRSSEEPHHHCEVCGEMLRGDAYEGNQCVRAGIPVKDMYNNEHVHCIESQSCGDKCHLTSPHRHCEISGCGDKCHLTSPHRHCEISGCGAPMVNGAEWHKERHERSENRVSITPHINIYNAECKFCGFGGKFPHNHVYHPPFNGDIFNEICGYRGCVVSSSHYHCVLCQGETLRPNSVCNRFHCHQCEVITIEDHGHCNTCFKIMALDMLAEHYHCPVCTLVTPADHVHDV